jgi:hypothetical protein
MFISHGLTPPQIFPHHQSYQTPPQITTASTITNVIIHLHRFYGTTMCVFKSGTWLRFYNIVKTPIRIAESIDKGRRLYCSGG